VLDPPASEEEEAAVDLIEHFGDSPSRNTRTFGIIRSMGADAPRFPNKRVDTPEYRGHYNRGWETSQKASLKGIDGALERADNRGEPEAWYDGYTDYAVGRKKWHSLTCPSSEHEAPGCSDYDEPARHEAVVRKTGWGPSHWQHRDCGVYAKALTDADPSLRIGAVAGPHSDPSTGHALHWFAHDDTHAYDSRGEHPLPYISVWDSLRNDYFPDEEHESRGHRQVLDVPVGHFGDLTDEQNQMLPAARKHIRQNKILRNRDGRTSAAQPPAQPAAQGAAK